MPSQLKFDGGLESVQFMSACTDHHDVFRLVQRQIEQIGNFETQNAVFGAGVYECVDLDRALAVAHTDWYERQ